MRLACVAGGQLRVRAGLCAFKRKLLDACEGLTTAGRRLYPTPLRGGRHVGSEYHDLAEVG